MKSNFVESRNSKLSRFPNVDDFTYGKRVKNIKFITDTIEEINYTIKLYGRFDREGWGKTDPSFIYDYVLIKDVYESFGFCTLFQYKIDDEYHYKLIIDRLIVD